MNIRLVMQISTPATLLYGCGGGGDSNSGSAPTPPLVTAETSYKNFKSVGLTPQTLPTGRTGVGTVRAYGDFSRSGQLDLFTATLTYWPPRLQRLPRQASSSSGASKPTEHS